MTVEGSKKNTIRVWRKHRDLTLVQLGEKAGVTAGLLSALERGRSGYTQRSLEAIATALKVEPGQLLGSRPGGGSHQEDRGVMEFHLKEWREYRGFTQQALARVAKTSNGQISRLEHGLQNGTVKTWDAIAAALDVTLEQLRAFPSDSFHPPAMMLHEIVVTQREMQRQLLEIDNELKRLRYEQNNINDGAQFYPLAGWS